MKNKKLRNRRITWLCLGLLFVGCLTGSSADLRTKNVFLITLDGVRYEEMFTGANEELLKAATKSDKPESHPLYQRYWAETPEERREKVMPFFWKTWMKQDGSIAGNRNKGSEMELSNRHHFSYPGYSEILTGQAHDAEINSNDKIQNPFPTVLEFFQGEWDLPKEKVAAFASWDVFEFIVESRPGTIYANSGFQAYDHPDAGIQLLAQAQMETRTPWNSVRHDFYTFQFAMAHLKRFQPPVFYLALGETDDWAHDNRYDRVLEALEQSDRYLKDLWEYLQSQPQYRDQTSILMTTDHGRGDLALNWTSHNARLPNAKFTWLAVISPDCSLRGEWSETPVITTSQIAATLSWFGGLDYLKQNCSAGNPIETILKATR